MEIILEYLKCFLVGGIICAIGQLLIDLTKLTPARILTSYVVAGVLLTGVGIYEKLVKFSDMGATTVLSGFGYSLAKGVETAVDKQGLLGALTGGLTATSAGITAAILFSLIASLIFKSRPK